MEQTAYEHLIVYPFHCGVCQVEVARLGLGFTQVVLDLMKGGVRMVEEHDGIDAIESVQ